MPNQYTATSKQAEIIPQGSFSYRKYKLTKIKLYFMENSSATLMRTWQAFQVAAMESLPLSTRNPKKPDKLKMLSGSSCTF